MIYKFNQLTRLSRVNSLCEFVSRDTNIFPIAPFDTICKQITQGDRFFPAIFYKFQNSKLGLINESLTNKSRMFQQA